MAAAAAAIAAVKNIADGVVFWEAGGVEREPVFIPEFWVSEYIRC